MTTDISELKNVSCLSNCYLHVSVTYCSVCRRSVYWVDRLPPTAGPHGTTEISEYSKDFNLF